MGCRMTNMGPSGMLMWPVNINHSTSPWLLPALQCYTTAYFLSQDHLILSPFKYFVKAQTIGCQVLKVYKIDPQVNSTYDFSISSPATSRIILGRDYQTGFLEIKKNQTIALTHHTLFSRGRVCDWGWKCLHVEMFTLSRSTWHMVDTQYVFVE